MFRTDENNNPTAMTVDVAAAGGLVEGVDYVQGTPFEVEQRNGSKLTLYTAKLLGDPVAITIRCIDKCGFYTGDGPVPGSLQRWPEFAMLFGLWERLDLTQKTAVIGMIYTFEGGTEMKRLFGL
jgi:hypothetical protein